MRRITLAEAQGRLGSLGNLATRFAPSREAALREYSERLERARVVGSEGPGSDAGDAEGSGEGDASLTSPDGLSQQEKLSITAAVAELGEEEAAELMGLPEQMTADIAEENSSAPLVKDYVEGRLARARKLSSRKLVHVLNSLTQEKIRRLDAKDAAAVAKDLTTVATKLGEKKDNRKVIVIGEFRPRPVNYPAIDIKAEPIQ